MSDNKFEVNVDMRALLSPAQLARITHTKAKTHIPPGREVGA